MLLLHLTHFVLEPVLVFISLLVFLLPLLPRQSYVQKRQATNKAIDTLPTIASNPIALVWAHAHAQTCFLFSFILVIWFVLPAGANISRKDARHEITQSKVGDKVFLCFVAGFVSNGSVINDTKYTCTAYHFVTVPRCILIFTILIGHLYTFWRFGCTNSCCYRMFTLLLLIHIVSFSRWATATEHGRMTQSVWESIR